MYKHALDDNDLMSNPLSMVQDIVAYNECNLPLELNSPNTKLKHELTGWKRVGLLVTHREASFVNGKPALVISKYEVKFDGEWSKGVKFNRCFYVGDADAKRIRKAARQHIESKCAEVLAEVVRIRKNHIMHSWKKRVQRRSQ